MKKYGLAILLLAFLPLVVTLAVLPALPDTIPAHFNAAGEVDRWGGKHELLIFPRITIGFAIILAQVMRFAARQEGGGTNNERILGLTTVLSLVLFDAMALYFLWIAFTQTESLNDLPVDVNQLTMGILGVMLIILGNVMPKARRNGILGLRTSFSQKSDDAWKISQRIGGAGLMITGVVMVIAAVLTRGLLCMMLCLAALLIGCTASVIIAGRAVSKIE